MICTYTECWWNHQIHHHKKENFQLHAEFFYEWKSDVRRGILQIETGLGVSACHILTAPSPLCPPGPETDEVLKWDAVLQEALSKKVTNFHIPKIIWWEWEGQNVLLFIVKQTPQSKNNLFPQVLLLPAVTYLKNKV